MPLPAWLPTWLTNLLGTGWLRGMLGIRKDLIDTKKAKLEVKKLQHEEKVRDSPITLATFEHVKQYDPKTRKLLRRVRKQYRRYDDDCLDMMSDIQGFERYRWRRQYRLLAFAIGITILLLAGIVLYILIW